MKNRQRPIETERNMGREGCEREAMREKEQRREREKESALKKKMIFIIINKVAIINVAFNRSENTQHFLHRLSFIVVQSNEKKQNEEEEVKEAAKFFCAVHFKFERNSRSPSMVYPIHSHCSV